MPCIYEQLVLPNSTFKVWVCSRSSGAVLAARAVAQTGLQRAAAVSRVRERWTGYKEIKVFAKRQTRTYKKQRKCREGIFFFCLHR